MDNEISVGKRGQVAIFVIVGIVLVVGIVIMFVFIRDEPEGDVSTDLNPKEFIDKCVRDAVEDSVEVMLVNGGEAEMSQSIRYFDEDYNYLCYHEGFDQGCFNIHPMLEVQVEREIWADSYEDVQDCFLAMREDFEARGHEVGSEGSGAISYSVDLLPGHVGINLNMEFYISKGESSQSFEDFDTRVVSPIYDLIWVARDIVNSEAESGNFNHAIFMLLYPEYDVKMIDHDSSTLYVVKDRKTGSEFKFAVRSFVSPTGFL